MFITFRQNNTHGYYVGPVYVCFEVDSIKEANELAEASGVVYFDGVGRGMDCDCCGDRWYPVLDEEDLTETPTMYGDPLVKVAKRHSESYQILYRNGNVENG